ncbi:translation initiation factor IF-2 [Geosporobacter subterraneus DSM 17957]|uniref:Translation initiation factor IF-2 n=1 Tax=Geosporobacter subterraneus DSM 17957 TaxID=1121919 RepID=A0A1M6E0C4_9FIRM|nr:translation initiation factor IF-2 [Geosporobacter subterraneus]SHI78962.1 translation initiation factor IF-2 [Geosporobacter subterraneus DSM 17957]
MSKIRVYQIAKDLGVSSKELISKLAEFGVQVANHMSTLEDEEVDIIMEMYNGEDNKSSSEPPKVEKSIEEPKKASKNKHHKENMEKPSVQNMIEEKTIKIEGSITVKDFADLLGKGVSEVMTKLIALGVFATINQEIDFDTASVVASDYGISVEKTEEKEEVEVGLEQEEDRPEDLKERPPVITVMGHVDHGKTSLLDAIRKTHVTAKEAGGITQHIGASEVEVRGKKIVFLDTPGHEAFTSMRARGAKVTDIAILVVAADDGVMPQTIEALSHAKAANVPIIVAMNKIDKPGINPDRVKQELADQGLLVEEWGGDTILVPVSAHTREGLDTLLEMILLVAEMQELKANPNRLASGTVIEAKLDKGRGPVATILVQNGTLKVGDAVVAGSAYGRVRAMVSDKGKNIKKAGPSTAVEILGLSDAPEAGDLFNAVKEDKIARQIGEKRKAKFREENLHVTAKVTLEDLFKQIKEGSVKELNIIVKADVQGSVEAVKQSMVKLSNEEVKVKVIHGGVGTITESDILLASASNAIIIGFNVRPSSAVSSLAERENVDLRTYRIIYEAISDVEAAMKGMLEPEYKEVVLGKVEIRATFKVPGIGTIGGAYVMEGKVSRNAKARLIRDGIVIHEGSISSLKRFKDDAKEVNAGYECGIGLENYNDIKEGDIVEPYIIEEVKRG